MATRSDRISKHEDDDRYDAKGVRCGKVLETQDYQPENDFPVRFVVPSSGDLIKSTI